MKRGGRLVLHIDGASRGNPGEAAWGVHVSDDRERTLAELRGRIGRATNNVAEYQALVHALRWALGQGAQRVRVLSDSELLVRQMQGRYRVKNPGLAALHGEAQALLSRFEEASLAHVPRERNREADRLANLALDEPEPRPEPADPSLGSPDSRHS